MRWPWHRVQQQQAWPGRAQEGAKHFAAISPARWRKGGAPRERWSNPNTHAQQFSFSAWRWSLPGAGSPWSCQRKAAAPTNPAQWNPPTEEAGEGPRDSPTSTEAGQKPPGGPFMSQTPEGCPVSMGRSPSCAAERGCSLPEWALRPPSPSAADQSAPLGLGFLFTRLQPSAPLGGAFPLPSESSQGSLKVG